VKLIADSGSTKTDWCLMEGNQVVLRIKTAGFNPYFQSRKQIAEEILLTLRPHMQDYIGRITETHYYGTGCSTAENCKVIDEALTESLEVTNNFVAHDLLAAARALCQNEWGIASILGTGSNSGLYNGREVIENVPSTGYLWSDYGGGSQIGKFFIRDYFEGKMPADLKLAFEAAGYNREVILNNVYKSAVPARYLASVSLFAQQYKDHPFTKQILKSCFDSFFEQQVNKYSDSKKYKVHTVGSVGFFFKDQFAHVASQHGYQIGNVIQSPMEGLIIFHGE
jgi:glucosamine kinase